MLADGNGDSPGLATYRDLGSFQLLLSLQDDEALRLFCDSILAPIEDGEGAYGGEPMRSLEAFLEGNGAGERAGRPLHWPRHTPRYRSPRADGLPTPPALALPVLRDPGEIDAADRGLSLAAEVWQRSPRQVCLLLDDVHEIGRHSAGASSISFSHAWIARAW